MRLLFGRRRSSAVSRVVACVSLVAALHASTSVASAATASETAAVLAPIDRLIRGIDGQSAGTIASTYVFAPSIVDEFAPFRWSGGAAATSWYRDFGAMAQTYKLTHIRVSRHAPSYVTIAKGRAWLVVPTDFAYSAEGKAQRESAAWTFVLVSGARGWRIEASTWAKTAGAP